MPDDIDPIGKSRTSTIYPEGIIAFAQQVVDRVDWQVGQQIVISNLNDLPTTLLFRRADPDDCGFILSFANRNRLGGSGGKLSCRRIVGKIVRPRLRLPLRNISPIYLSVDKKSGFKPYQIAFLLQEPNWIDIEFSATSAESIPQRLMGVYQVANSDPDQPLRIGQGFIQNRLKENLKIGELQTARRFYYFPMTKKEDMVLLEHILLQRYKQQNGDLPSVNRITA